MTKADLKGGTGTDTSTVGSKTDLAASGLITKVDNLDVDKLTTVLLISMS